MTSEKQKDFMAELFGTFQDHIDEIERDLRCTYISRWPFCVALEDYSMAVAYDELEGVQDNNAVYRLSSRPADALRFSREGADTLAAEWNSDPVRPRVRAMGHHDYYRGKLALLRSLQDVFAPAIAE